MAVSFVTALTGENQSKFASQMSQLSHLVATSNFYTPKKPCRHVHHLGADRWRAHDGVAGGGGGIHCTGARATLRGRRRPPHTAHNFRCALISPTQSCNSAARLTQCPSHAHQAASLHCGLRLSSWVPSSADMSTFEMSCRGYLRSSAVPCVCRRAGGLCRGGEGRQGRAQVAGRGHLCTILDARRLRRPAPRRPGAIVTSGKC